MADVFPFAGVKFLVGITIYRKSWHKAKFSKYNKYFKYLYLSLNRINSQKVYYTILEFKLESLRSHECILKYPRLDSNSSLTVTNYTGDIPRGIRFNCLLSVWLRVSNTIYFFLLI